MSATPPWWSPGWPSALNTAWLSIFNRHCPLLISKGNFRSSIPIARWFHILLHRFEIETFGQLEYQEGEADQCCWMLHRGQGRYALKGRFRNKAITGYYFVKIFSRGSGENHTTVGYQNRWGSWKRSGCSQKLFNKRIVMKEKKEIG